MFDLGPRHIKDVKNGTMVGTSLGVQPYRASCHYTHKHYTMYEAKNSEVCIPNLCGSGTHSRNIIHHAKHVSWVRHSFILIYSLKPASDHVFFCRKCLCGE